ncbi:type II toxin-antitoxin system Phd/YefM family antitoxin [Bengtsoniella intestinalis]|uniref:type II toxin-antitoxin system Phd/YefM family antitoxin n=1 Tax=Bengtsoniella intestinalis TaxID=3073143 RepID=UPI00391F0EE9
MNIKPSTALRNEYPQISQLAKASGEPIFITNKGESDMVVMSMQAYEEREKMFRHRDMVYQAELSRLSGAPAYTSDQVDAKMEDIFRAYES